MEEEEKAAESQDKVHLHVLHRNMDSERYSKEPQKWRSAATSVSGFVRFWVGLSR